MNTRRALEQIFALLAFVVLAAPDSLSQRRRLAPALRPGQILFYRIDFSSSRNTKTTGPIASSQSPPASTVVVTGLLQVEIVQAGVSGLHLKTYYSERRSNTAPSRSRDSSNSDKMVEVSIAPNGTASQIKGLDQLSPAQQFVWNDWLGRFTSSMTFPTAGTHAGQKWQTTEPETDPSPIAELFWIKKYEYVRDAPCLTDAGLQKANPTSPVSTANVCAVVVIQSTLRQRSSSKNSTPDDYKVRNLKTSGSASGKNDTILYFALSSGLMVRSTEDAQQSMDVLVALADGSNAVRYTLDAKSHSDILLLPDSPQATR